MALSRGPSGQAVSRGARKTLTRGQRSVQRGQAAAGVQQVGLLCDLTEQRVPLLAAGQTDRQKEKRQEEKIGFGIRRAHTGVIYIMCY